MRAKPAFACLLVGMAALSACTYHVRESNIVIARAAPTADLPALRAAYPAARITKSALVMDDGTQLATIGVLRGDALATVLYFGGNGYTMSKFAVATVAAYGDVPVNVVLVDHRGYGDSAGTPSIALLMADALQVYDSVRGDPGLAALPVIVHGHSLGSFMAGGIARQRRLDGLVLEGSVTTTEDWMAALRSKQNPMIRAVVWKVAPDDALAGKGNRDVVAGLDEPVLFVVGANDDVAPPRLSQALFDATPLPADRKQLLIVPGHGHMDATASPEFRAAFAVLVGEAVAARGQSLRSPAAN